MEHIFYLNYVYFLPIYREMCYTVDEIIIKGQEVLIMVTMIKILVKIVKIWIAVFKISGAAQRWVDEMEERYSIK